MSTLRRSSSVAKAFELIRVVADTGSRGAGLQELARAGDVAVSTAHRYATSLLDLGVLERDPSGSFRLGVALVALAGQCLEEDVLRRVAHPYLVELSELSGETTHLGVRLGDRLVYVDKVESEKSVRLVSRVGSQAPMHCTSMGKALLSVMSDQERDEILSAATERPTPRTIFGAALLEELDRVREQGYAIDDEENEEGVRCMGIPLLNSDGVPVAAMSVSAPAGRFGLDDCRALAPTALSIAQEINRKLGYPGDREQGAPLPSWRSVDEKRRWHA